ncbi:MAG TPA: dihydrolipoamide acetyltransferase family protein [Chitinispirillaceae bacterium]|nr:dihydrolipoamide acetyltransferase family protein [Chitinispirillaceae bacterium]
MANKILMLALSPTMESGTIAHWSKHEGDEVHDGDVLCEVETDKATMDYESTIEGKILKIVAPEGASVKVGELIAIAGSEGEDISGLLSKKTDGHVRKETVAVKENVAAEQEAPSEPSKTARRVKASPLAREIADRNGVDINSITGSGPEGRIIKEDVEKVLKLKQTGAPSGAPQPVTAQEKTSIPLTEKRKAIARRLSESMFTAPHFYMTISAGADAILSARKRVNSNRNSKVSLNAFLIKLTAETLRRHPAILTSWNGDSIIQFGSVDVAVAVAQKDGLITPVVRNCTAKGIIEIDNELKELVTRARENKLRPEEYTGCTFTISNLGSYGIRQFTAIINPPASAILAVGEVFREIVFDDNGDEAARNTMLMTLSCDHRVIDGAVAALFAADLKAAIEDPFSVLL